MGDTLKARQCLATHQVFPLALASVENLIWQYLQLDLKNNDIPIPTPPHLPQLSQCQRAHKLLGEFVSCYLYRSVNFFLQVCNFQSNLIEWFICSLIQWIFMDFLHMLSTLLYPEIPQWASHSQHFFAWKSILLTFVYRNTKTAQSNYCFTCFIGIVWLMARTRAHSCYCFFYESHFGFDMFNPVTPCK